MCFDSPANNLGPRPANLGLTLTNDSGGAIQVIAMNDASHVDCSMSGVEVFVVSRDLVKLNE